jgi:hypothetical protein
MENEFLQFWNKKAPFLEEAFKNYFYLKSFTHPTLHILRAFR